MLARSAVNPPVFALACVSPQSLTVGTVFFYRSPKRGAASRVAKCPTHLPSPNLSSIFHPPPSLVHLPPFRLPSDTFQLASSTFAPPSSISHLLSNVYYILYTHSENKRGNRPGAPKSEAARRSQARTLLFIDCAVVLTIQPQVHACACASRGPVSPEFHQGVRQGREDM